MEISQNVAKDYTSLNIRKPCDVVSHSMGLCFIWRGSIQFQESQTQRNRGPEEEEARNGFDLRRRRELRSLLHPHPQHADRGRIPPLRPRLGEQADGAVGGLPGVVRRAGGRRGHGHRHVGHRGRIRVSLREGLGQVGEEEEWGKTTATEWSFGRF